jgi:hypothetical protein
MTRATILILTIFLTINIYGQDKIRPILWFGPADSVTVYGINLSPFVYKTPVNSVINGINIEGIGIPFFLFMIPYGPNIQSDTFTIRKEFNINGINVAPAGIIQSGTVNGVAVTVLYSFIDQVSGVELSIFFNLTYKLNGLSVSCINSTVELNGIQIGLLNETNRIKGLQIGVLNKTRKMKGLQIGFWNINEKRKLPIINW